MNGCLHEHLIERRTEAPLGTTAGLAGSACRLKRGGKDADRVGMSDVSQGQGWWQASDGKWYAPPSSAGGWQQTATPPSPYPPPGPRPAFQPRTEGTATAALVTAIVGLPLCAPIGGIIALILASTASKKIAASGGALGGEGLVTAARIIGWIEVAFVGLAIVCIAAITLLGNNASTKFAPPP